MIKQSSVSSLEEHNVYDDMPILVAGTHFETRILKKVLDKKLSFEEIAERKGYDEGARQLEKALQKVITIKEPVFIYRNHTADMWPNTKDHWEDSYFREHFLEDISQKFPYSMIIATGNLRTYDEYSLAGGGMRTASVVKELQKTAQRWAIELYLVSPFDHEKFSDI